VRLKERPLAWDAFQKRACSTLARGTTREHQSILELITLFSSLVFDTVATPLHQLGSSKSKTMMIIMRGWPEAHCTRG
jgi:hypothetical protein